MEAKKTTLESYLKVSRRANPFYTATKIQTIIESFVNSSEPVVEITWAEGEYKNGYSCYSSIYNYLKRNGKDKQYRVRVLDNGKRVFLINNFRFEKAINK